MMAQLDSEAAVTRTERGLSVAGTRITLYNIMDCLKAGWPPALIQARYDLTDDQLEGVLTYIDAHRDAVEAEYNAVVERAEEIKKYWEGKNRRRFAEIESKRPQPGREKIHGRLNAWKERLARI
jgi:uncharacterized protein (DUF433 family)